MAYLGIAPPPKSLTSHLIPALFSSQRSWHLLLTIIRTASLLAPVFSSDPPARLYFVCHSTEAYHFSHPPDKNQNILNIYLSNPPALNTVSHLPSHSLDKATFMCPWPVPSLPPCSLPSTSHLPGLPLPQCLFQHRKEFLNENFLSSSQTQSPVHSASILTPCPPTSEVR